MDKRMDGCVGGGEAFFSVLFSVMPGYYLI